VYAYLCSIMHATHSINLILFDLIILVTFTSYVFLGVWSWWIWQSGCRIHWL
jgi:hypothetical protein